MRERRLLHTGPADRPSARGNAFKNLAIAVFVLLPASTRTDVFDPSYHDLRSEHIRRPRSAMNSVPAVHGLVAWPTTAGCAAKQEIAVAAIVASRKRFVRKDLLRWVECGRSRVGQHRL